MPVTGWTNVSLSDDDMKTVMELGEWLLADTGIKVTPPRSIRAMASKLKQIKESEDRGTAK